ncbi:hypothetical protein RHMOL_Rhmol03G0023200 [Rhododendron molle]|uniref:Uncharacterized protein n=1 Tax=Rhododendron molle TaxID=49168 RepID=A0ACC0P9C3_RHOML|nr:hypothetical protein RHMOL_Rhmol03G0023200 [Rhododendron molle]
MIHVIASYLSVTYMYKVSFERENQKTLIMGFTYQMPSFRFHVYEEADSLQIPIATNLIFLEAKNLCKKTLIMGFTYQMPSFRFHVYEEADSLQIPIATNLIFLEAKNLLKSKNAKKKEEEAWKEKKKVFVDYDEGSHNVSVQLSGIRKADLPQHKRVRVAGERFQKDWPISEVVQRVLGIKHWEDIEGLLNRCKPDAETFNALINVHGRAGQWRWAMNIKDDMLRAAVCICTLLPYRC